MTTREALRRSGAAMREKLGFSPNSPETEPAPGFDRLAEEAVWGSIWARPGLALDDRMLAVLGVGPLFFARKMKLVLIVLAVSGYRAHLV